MLTRFYKQCHFVTGIFYLIQKILDCCCIEFSISLQENVYRCQIRASWKPIYWTHYLGTILQYSIRLKLCPAKFCTDRRKCLKSFPHKIYKHKIFHCAVVTYFRGIQQFPMHQFQSGLTHIETVEPLNNYQVTLILAVTTG